MYKWLSLYIILTFVSLLSCTTSRQADLSEVKSFFDGLENDSFFVWQEIMAENLERDASAWDNITYSLKVKIQIEYIKYNIFS